MTSKSPEYTETFLLIVMGTEFPIKRYLNVFGIACLYVFVCACLCVYMHIAVLLHKSFRGLLHIIPCQENKHCLYYSNEYALGSKLYNFPLTLLIKCQEWLRETCDI